MKRYYSLKSAISLLINAIILFGVPLFFVILAYVRGTIHPDNYNFPIWVISFIPLSIIALGLISSAFYNFRKINITKNSVKVSLFSILFVKEFAVDTIVDIKAIYQHPTNKNPRQSVKVVFSKLPICDFAPPKTEKQNHKKNQIKFSFEEKDIAILKEMFSAIFREDKQSQKF